MTKPTLGLRLRIAMTKPFIYLPIILLPIVGGVNALRIQLWCMDMIRKIVVGNK